MAFKYQQPPPGLQGLQYPSQQPQEEQQGQGIDPGTMMNAYQQFAGGSGAAGGSGGSGAVSGLFGGGGSGGSGAVSGLFGSGGSAGGAAGGSSAGGGSAVASAGPWAALAAIIYANESYASAHGDRDPDDKEYAKDLFSGEVFHQDMEKRWLPNIGIDEGSKESKAISFMANPLHADPGKSWERLKDIF